MGASGVVVGLAVITLSVEVFKMNPRLAWYLSTFLATLSNFFLNNYYTWSERKAQRTKELSRKISLYYLLTILSIALNYLIYNLLLTKGFHYFIAVSFAIVSCAILNFVLNELVVWPKKTKI